MQRVALGSVKERTSKADEWQYIQVVDIGKGIEEGERANADNQKSTTITNTQNTKYGLQSVPS
jgi:hypothetical protein